MGGYISIILFCSLMISYFIFNIKNRKIIAKHDLVLDSLNIFQKAVYVPFFVLVTNTDLATSYLLSDQVKESMRYFYESKYYRYYESLFIAKKLTYLFYLMAFISFISTLINNSYLLLIAVVLGFIISLLQDQIEIKKYANLKQELKFELPLLMTRLSLLINAGLVYREAIKLIINSGQGALIMELKKTHDFIENGRDEKTAYDRIAYFSEDRLVKKFISLVVQNLYKGSENFSIDLKELKKETFVYKENQMIEQSKKATQKLLIPNLLVFSAIMLMVMLPILINVFQ